MTLWGWASSDRSVSVFLFISLAIGLKVWLWLNYFFGCKSTKLLYTQQQIAQKILLNQLFSEKHGHAISLIHSKNLKWKHPWWRRNRDVEIKKAMYNSSSLAVSHSPCSPPPSCSQHCWLQHQRSGGCHLLSSQSMSQGFEIAERHA